MREKDQSNEISDEAYKRVMEDYYKEEDNRVNSKSIEHRAWDILAKRLEHLNGFVGNRATMGKINEEFEKALAKAKEEYSNA